ncbi:uncharacterized protein LOC119191162 [Manduca sexta]|nr:uncharacterized protein LOC119191162 [Manduca sexta]
MCPPCGYGVAALVGLCCCGVCVSLALLVHVTSRSCGTTDNNAKESSELPTKDKSRMNPGPTRSSRVIFAKFFKPSLTSSMATDSQETKFDTWKARNRPPPLPPVDFDS